MCVCVRARARVCVCVCVCVLTTHKLDYTYQLDITVKCLMVIWIINVVVENGLRNLNVYNNQPSGIATTRGGRFILLNFHL